MTFFSNAPSVSRIADASITVRQAVRTSTGGHVVPATSSLRVNPFVGLALASGSSGNLVNIQVSGVIDPNFFNLGDGYACAVGVNSSGIPVRATDSTCASAPNWIGFCDTNGNITVSPIRRNEFNPHDFGAVGDNVTDDWYSLQTMLDAMQPGDTAFIPIPPSGGNFGGFAVSRDLLVKKSINFRGANKIRGGLHFTSASAGLRILGFNQLLDAVGDASGTYVGDLHIKGTKETISEWRPNTVYNVGDRVRSMLVAVALTTSDGYYNKPYQEDAGTHFRCVVGGISGSYGITQSYQPIWNISPNYETVDGNVTWVAEDWSLVSVSTSTVTIERCLIETFTDNGLYNYGRLGFQTPVKSSGTSPPTVTAGGEIINTHAADIRIEITTGGTLGTAKFRWSRDGGITWYQTNQTTAESYTLTSIGVTVHFSGGTYSTDNVYTFHSDAQTIADGNNYRDLWITTGDGHGILFDGGDANACTTYGSTFTGLPRGAYIFDSGFLSNIHIGHNGSTSRRSYVGDSSVAQTVWLGNYFEADTGNMKVVYPQLYLSGQNGARAPETNCLSYNGSIWRQGINVLGYRTSFSIGNSDTNVSVLTRDNDYSITEQFIDSDTDDPGGYWSKRWNSHFVECSEELTSGYSIYGANKKRFSVGFYLGHTYTSSGNRSIWVTSHIVPPGPPDYFATGKLIWDKGWLVYNQNSDGYVAPGWIASRKGGWGGGAYWSGVATAPSGGKTWVANTGSLRVSEGIEPSTPNGKVFRILRFETFNGTSWVRDDTTVFVTLSSTEPTWDAVNGNLTYERYPTPSSNSRIVWECWGNTGMTWAEMPKPTTFVYT
jgi:hypothetical protein